MLNKFTYDEYAELIDRLRDGRSFLTFSDFRRPAEADRYVILRHDVDFSPQAALELAECEARCNVQATYFFLFTSPYHNLLEESNVTIPLKIAQLGHEVGLHYDAGLLETVDAQRKVSLLKQQADALSRLSGRLVRSIAMHQPAYSGADPFARQDAYVNAYSPTFTSEIAYFSDSCGGWRDSAFEALTAKTLPPRLQLLTHPLFWGNTPGTRWDRLEQWVGAQKQALGGKVARVEEIWRAHRGALEQNRRTGQSDPSS